jgi:hypothetical protein
MTRTTFPLGLGAVALLGMPAMGFAQKAIVHNPNSYPVWVATGYFNEGVMDLTGGGNHAPNEVHSQGWVRIPPRDAHAFATSPSYLYVRAYSPNNKSWFQIRPGGADKPVNFFYKLDDFKEGFYVNGSLAANVQKKGGELKGFYPLKAYLNPADKRYEVTGPSIQGGEPNAPLPAAVATASFTNRTNSRVFYTVTSGGKSREGSLATGKTAQHVIELGDPPSTVTITQNDGGKLSFTLPQGAEYEFRSANGKIKNYSK